MKNTNYIYTGVILIVVVAITFFAITRPVPKAAHTPTAEELTATQSRSYTEKTAYYTIATNYASSTLLRTDVSVAVDDAAVAEMGNFVSDTVAQFKKDGKYTNLTPQDIQMRFNGGRTDSLNIVYLISTAPRTVSYIYTIYLDTGGAHGNTFFHTFTFDAVSGASLALADIFAPGTDYLTALSKIARAKLPEMLKEHMDAQMLSSGTAPDAKNFENFFIDNDTLKIQFAPYAVAPYSAGPQTLQIPLSDLANILKPEYR